MIKPMNRYTIELILKNVAIQKTKEENIVEIEYGSYPQSAAPKNLQIILEEKFKDNSKDLKITGNIYTTDATVIGDDYLWNRYKPNPITHEEDDLSFKEQNHFEYEYMGKRYIRTIIKRSTSFISNSVKYNEGDYIWIEVEPVKWVVDEKHQIIITKDIIVSGIPFDRNKEYYGDFECTTINEFINKYLLRDLFQKEQFNIVKQYDNLIQELYKKGFSLEKIKLITNEILERTQNNNLINKSNTKQKLKTIL